MNEFFAVVVGLNLVFFSALAVLSFQKAKECVSGQTKSVMLTLSAIAAVIGLAGPQLIVLELRAAGRVSAGVADFFLTWWMFPMMIGVTFVGVLAARSFRTLNNLSQSDRIVRVLTETVELDPSVSDLGLTARELEVLEEIVQGRTSDSAIAETLYISPSTAATHVRNIMKKAGVRSRNDLMLLNPTLDRSSIGSGARPS